MKKKQIKKMFKNLNSRISSLEYSINASNTISGYATQTSGSDNFIISYSPIPPNYVNLNNFNVKD